jgi:hypothetical protein
VTRAEKAAVAALADRLRAWFKRGAWLGLASDILQARGAPLKRAVSTLRRFETEVAAATGFPVKLDDAGGRWPPRLMVIRR